MLTGAKAQGLDSKSYFWEDQLFLCTHFYPTAESDLSSSEKCQASNKWKLINFYNVTITEETKCL